MNKLGVDIVQQRRSRVNIFRKKQANIRKMQMSSLPKREGRGEENENEKDVAIVAVA